jgi:hypothetical protein
MQMYTDADKTMLDDAAAIFVYNPYPPYVRPTHPQTCTIATTIEYHVP